MVQRDRRGHRRRHARLRAAHLDLGALRGAGGAREVDAHVVLLLEAPQPAAARAAAPDAQTRTHTLEKHPKLKTTPKVSLVIAGYTAAASHVALLVCIVLYAKSQSA